MVAPQVGRNSIGPKSGFHSGFLIYWMTGDLSSFFINSYEWHSNLFPKDLVKNVFEIWLVHSGTKIIMSIFNWWSRFLNWDVLSIQYQAEKNGNKYPLPNSPNYYQKNWMAMVRWITNKILGVEEFKTGGAFSDCLQFHNFLQGQLFLRHISKLHKNF